MEERNLICINCPMGCALAVTMNGTEVVKVSGNTCKRGDIYARKEVTTKKVRDYLHMSLMDIGRM